MRFVKLLAMIILATVSVHAQGVGGRPELAGRRGLAAVLRPQPLLHLFSRKVLAALFTVPVQPLAI